MSDSHAPSIFESFNARNLSADQVARTFVPQEQFEVLSKRSHALLVGPRGSGKTTLLKMLQPQALEVWNHDAANAYRNKIDYVGVFVASDVSWEHQRRSLGGARLDDETVELLGNAVFNAHILRAFCSSLMHRMSTEVVHSKHYKRIRVTKSQEAAAARALADVWRLNLAVPSLLGLKQAVLSRIAAIREIAAKEELLGAECRKERLASYAFLHSHFIDFVSAGAHLVNDVTGSHGTRWALLFDELEVAPKWVTEQLLVSLRSTDELLLFKLAMSPVSTLDLLEWTRTNKATLGQDFEQIRLWYTDKQEPYQFCNALWSLMLRERGLPQASAAEVLGLSYSQWDSGIPKQSAYASHGRLGRRFVRLAARDDSFRRYLKAKKLNPKQLDKVSSDAADQVIRKIAPLVVFREYFRKDKTRRSRKAAAIYAGEESMFAVTEGNPRIFIGMMAPLVARLDADQMRISASEQGQAIQRASDRFIAMLRSIPAQVPRIGGQVVSVDGLIQRIGRFIEGELIMGEFLPDPHSTIRIDPLIDRGLQRLIDLSVNAGALVYLPDTNAELHLVSVRGRRFRLSYLLAPTFHLPLRLDKEIRLSRMLRADPDRGTAELKFE